MSKGWAIVLGLGIGAIGTYLFLKYYTRIRASVDKPYAPTEMYVDYYAYRQNKNNPFYRRIFMEKWGITPEEAKAHYRFRKVEEQPEYREVVESPPQ